MITRAKNTVFVSFYWFYNFLKRSVAPTVLWFIVLGVQLSIVYSIVLLNSNVITRGGAVLNKYSLAPETLPSIHSIAPTTFPFACHANQSNPTMAYNLTAWYLSSLVTQQVKQDTMDDAVLSVSCDDLVRFVENTACQCDTEATLLEDVVMSPVGSAVCQAYCAKQGFLSMPLMLAIETNASLLTLGIQHPVQPPQDVTINITQSFDSTQISAVQRFLVDHNQPLLMELPLAACCTRFKLEDPWTCTNLVRKDGVYCLPSTRPSQTELTQAIVVGYTPEGFLVKGIERGHSLEYLMGRLSRVQELRLCNNTMSSSTWLSYDPTTQGQHTATQLTCREDYLSFHCDKTKQYAVVGDGTYVRVVDSVTVFDGNETFILSPMWPDLLETLFEPTTIHPADPEFCHFHLVPYSVFEALRRIGTPTRFAVGVKGFSVSVVSQSGTLTNHFLHKSVVPDGAYNLDVMGF